MTDTNNRDLPAGNTHDLPDDEPVSAQPAYLSSTDDLLAADEPLFDPDDTPKSGMHPIATRADIPTPRSGIRTPQQPKTNPSLRIAAARPESDVVVLRPNFLGAVMLGLSLLITIAAAVIYFTQSTQTPVETPTMLPTQIAAVATLPVTATTIPATNTAIPPTPMPGANLATPMPDGDVPPDVIAELLNKPGQYVPAESAVGVTFFRQQNAFTVAPVRSRSQPTAYRIQPGDNLESIAKKFGISQDTLIWNNDITYINRLSVGDELTILPVDGILHKTTGDETIRSIADKYKVSPYAIIDSEYNPLLQNANENTLIPAGVSIMVPGGTSTKKAIYWNPGITITKGTSNGSTRVSGGTASFGGGPGSCGPQPNVGGTGSFQLPLNGYIVQRGFTALHSGIDLSANTGTPVYAADSGTVIFAGWSNWGYGYSVVLAHGNFLTLYGHMSYVSARCGQSVGRGTVIGAVGSTGNSSGPHLHFEIRIGEVPVDPTGYLRF